MGKGRFCREFAVKTNKIMDLNTVKTVVVKIGTSTLTYENGKMNLRRIDKLCRTLCDLQNGGRRIVLVTSGAIGVGMGKLDCRSARTTPPKSRRLPPSASAS